MFLRVCVPQTHRAAVFFSHSSVLEAWQGTAPSYVPPAPEVSDVTALIKKGETREYPVINLNYLNLHESLMKTVESPMQNLQKLPLILRIPKDAGTPAGGSRGEEQEKTGFAICF